jgi:ATPase subunit of ABC transporter with duplicated ATPase domains
MLFAENLCYLHPNRDLLFEHISLVLNRHQKAALVGNNGVGKSTLLKLLAGQLQPTSGAVRSDSAPYYVPQHFGQYNGLTIAQALRIDAKLSALKAILDGDMSERNLDLLQDDWGIEERAREALSHWKLDGFDPDRPMDALSGGQKTRVFLAGVDIHEPELVLLDEPSNHLDGAGRALLYDFIRRTNRALLIVSHDRGLLSLPDTIWEMEPDGIAVYGGNFGFYQEQKALERAAFEQELQSAEKSLRKAKETAREVAERRQRLEARGRRKQEKAGTPTIMLNTLRNNAEKSSSKLMDAHSEKIGSIADDLARLRSELPAVDTMKLGFDDPALHTGKVLITANDLSFSYGDVPLWPEALQPEIRSGDRIAIEGPNGSGKSTLIRLLLGGLQPLTGTIARADFRAVYLDQDYSIVDNAATVYEQAQRYNDGGLEEHELKRRLTHFLFMKDDWDKPCAGLSGGEKMRLMLCCLSIGAQVPALIVLDEPTNNLDLQNIGILTAAVRSYKGTLIVVSHDRQFLEDVSIDRAISLRQV